MKTTKTATVFALIVNAFAFGQVGIQTETPKATLDVVGSPTDTSQFDGIIAPRITGEELRAKTYSADQTGALVYVTAADTDPADQTEEVTVSGYYYFNGTKWLPASSNKNIYNTDGTLTEDRYVTFDGNSLNLIGSDQMAIFQEDGYLSLKGTDGDYRAMYRLLTEDRDGNGVGGKFEVNLFADNSLQLFANDDVSSFTLGTHYTLNSSPIAFVTSSGGDTSGTEKMIITGEGNVGIGTSSPEDSAILDIDVSALATGNKKGFLGPRVALTSRTDDATIPNPATGLLVYNLGTGGLTFSGYIYWNGSEWRNLNNLSLETGTVNALNCSSGSLSPGTYTSATPYSGQLTIPYTGGNGGIYPAQTVGPVNGLTATIAAGNFAYGSGTLTYTVSGTPTITSPSTTTFPISIGGRSCSAEVGIGSTIAVGQEIYWYGQAAANIGSGGLNATTNLAANYLSNYASDIPVLDGLRFDFYFIASATAAGTISGLPRLVNVSGGNLKVWFSAMSSVQNFGTSNILLGPGHFINLDDGIYNGFGINMTTASTPASYTSPATGHTEIETVDILVNNRWYRATYYPVIDNNNTAAAADDIRKIAISVKRLR